MDGDRIALAKARIEAAVRRIEAAAIRPPGIGPDAGAGANGEADREQARKYQALRGEAEAALAELDRMIAALEA